MIPESRLAPISQLTTSQTTDHSPKGLSLAINSFAGDLCQVYSAKRSLAHKNFVFFTPAMISIFSLIYSTSPDSLKTEIEKAMHMGDLRGQVWHQHVRNWLNTLCKVNDLYEMVQKNMVLTEREMNPQVRAEFDQQEVQYTVFSNSAQAISDANAWVNTVTQGKIPTLLQDIPAEDLAFILTSAALFNGQWSRPFDLKQTSILPFHNSNGTVANVSTMHIEESLKRAIINGVHIVEKPYKGNISMYFISPQDRDVAQAVLKLKAFMTVNVLNEFMGKRHECMTMCRNLNVYVPYVEFKDRSNVLEDLNGTDLANAIKRADFRSALVNPMGPPIKMPLIQSEVHLQVDEKGTSIAQALAGVARPESVCQLEELHIDRPFGLVMVDHLSQTILCMGQVYQMEPVRRVQPSQVRETINATCAHVYSRLAEKNLLENRNFSFAMPSLMHALGLISHGAKETIRPILKEQFHLPDLANLGWHGELAERLNVTLNYSFRENPNFLIIVNNQKNSNSFDNVINYYISLDTDEKKIGVLNSAGLNSLISKKSEGVVQELENCPSEIGYSFVQYTSFLRNKWLKPFARAKMAMGEFINHDGSHVSVPMMTMVDKLRHFQTEEVEAIEKEYVNGMSLIIVKPTAKKGARQLINFLNGDNLKKMLMDPKAFSTKSISLTVPKVQLVNQVDFFDALPLKGELIDNDPAPLSLFRGITAFALDEGGEANVSEDVDMDAEKFVVNGPFAMVMVDTANANIVYMSNVLKL